MPDRRARAAFIVEVDLAVLAGIIEHVLALAADGAYRDRHRSLALEDRAVVVAMQVEPDVARLARGEGAIDVRRRTGGTRCFAEHLHLHMLPIHANHRGAVGVVGGVQVHLAGRAAGSTGRPRAATRPVAAPAPRAGPGR